MVEVKNTSNKSASMTIQEQKQNNDKKDVEGLITHKILINLVIEQGHEGDHKQFMNEDEIKLDEVENIRIEFLKIVKIEMLWSMVNLVKLTLSHNLIEKIENLNNLIKLKELNLSFNCIKKMENLDSLVALEILILTGNEITTIEGIDNLENLTIFSIADNNIETRDHVIYLRKFSKLRSLNLTGNPCTEVNDYKNYLIAFLTQLKYYHYVLINEDDRMKASEIYRRDIVAVEKGEMQVKNALEKKRNLEIKERNDYEAFVEHLDNAEFFDILFQHDKCGSILKSVNDETLAIYEEYRQSFSDICRGLYEFGLIKNRERLDEVEEFTATVDRARTNVCETSKQIIDTILKKRNEIIIEFNRSIKSDLLGNDDSNKEFISNEEDGISVNKNIIRAQEIVDEFNEFLSEMWTELLENQVLLHEQFEDVIEILRNNLTDMKDEFLEFVSNNIARMRDALTQYRDNINRVVSLYISSIGDGTENPVNFINICDDPNTFSNNLSTSYDIQLHIIDDREDSIVNRINSWLENVIDQLNAKENDQYQHRILEISHFLQSVRNRLINDLFGSNKIALDVAEVLDD